jgi:hypothetical protein
MPEKRRWRPRKGRDLASFWPHLPDLDFRVDLRFTGAYAAPDFERITRAFRSSSMDNHWDMNYSAPWLTVHRSWTGLGVYGLRFEQAAEGVRVVESWVNRDCNTGDEDRLAYHKELVVFLIDVLLPGKPRELPKFLIEQDSD